MIKFAFISPIGFQEEAMKESDIHLALAHIKNKTYIEMFANREDNKLLILDNGAYENGKPIDDFELLDLGAEFKADILVAPDYPGELWSENVRKQLAFYDLAKQAGFDVMFVPHSIKGDLDGYMRAYTIFKNCMDTEKDLIGISILGAPNALPNVPRSFARWHILKSIDKLSKHTKHIHMLGLLDTPYEVALCNQFEHLIYSWDSSQPVWAGYMGLNIKEITDKEILPKVDFELLWYHDLCKINIEIFKKEIL